MRCGTVLLRRCGGSSHLPASAALSISASLGAVAKDAMRRRRCCRAAPRRSHRVVHRGSAVSGRGGDRDRIRCYRRRCVVIHNRGCPACCDARQHRHASCGGQARRGFSPSANTATYCQVRPSGQARRGVSPSANTATYRQVRPSGQARHSRQLSLRRLWWTVPLPHDLSPQSRGVVAALDSLRSVRPSDISGDADAVRVCCGGELAVVVVVVVIVVFVVIVVVGGRDSSMAVREQGCAAHPRRAFRCA
jgi:hypothetical protein